MKMRLIQCNEENELKLTSDEKEEGLLICLVDDRNVSIAIYSFDSKKLKNTEKLSYKSSNTRIKFDGITPTMIYELNSCND